MKKKILCAALLCAVLFLTSAVAVSIRDNKSIEVTEHLTADGKLPASFEGFTIAQISDLHDESFGDGNETLLRLLSEAAPDLIAITGDISDGNRMEFEDALAFIPAVAEIAPCYFVPGNHESGIGENYRLLEDRMRECGVEILTDSYLYLSRGSDRIVLAGLQDPYFVSEHKVFGKKGYGVIREKLEKLALPREEYTILLSHRPEAFELYVEAGADLVLTGHTHGGQIRLPLIGGLVAPHQGLFPKYDAGMYEKDGTKMYISRGLGNSVVPLRVNDRPELAVFRLTAHTEKEADGQ